MKGKLAGKITIFSGSQANALASDCKSSNSLLGITNPEEQQYRYKK
jgi:hypothetical protein